MIFSRHWLLVISFSLLGIAAASADSLPAGHDVNSIDDLLVSRSGGSNIVLKVDFRNPLLAPPASFSIANPSRLIFDLPSTENALGYASKTVNDGNLRSLNVVQSGDRTRLVMTLEKPPRFETRLDGRSLFITLNENETPMQSEGERTSLAQHFSGIDRPEGQAIRDIRFRRNKDGAGVVVVDLSAPDSGIDIQQKGANLLVSFKKTRLPDNLRRQMDVIDFATPVTTVKTKTSGEDVSMEIAPKGLWEHTAFQTDNQFVVEIRPLKEDPNKLFQGSKTGYQGEAISLNFQNIPLRELLHVFADITNFNIVVSDSVGGNVSLRLNEVPWDHALEIVLQQKNLAMRKSGNVLWIAPRDELAARDKLEAEAREAAIAAEVPRMEVFQLNFQKAEDFAAMLTGVGNSSGGAPVAATGQSTTVGFLSQIGKVSVDKRTNQIFVYDVPSKLEMVQSLLTKVDKPARQVLIEARIVEADTSFTKALGARLGGQDQYGMDIGHRILGTNTRYGISATTTDAYVNLPERRYTWDGVSTDSDGNPSYGTLPGTKMIGTSAYYDNGQLKRKTVLPTTRSDLEKITQFSDNAISNPVGQFALTLFNNAKTQLLTLELTALEQDGMGKTISSPRVLTADQVEAHIEQGFRIPYPVATASGGTSIAYLNATLALNVKPQITPDGRVMMNIKINKDAPYGAEGRWGYTVKTKEIKSDVLIENGGTVVIGGIFEQTDGEENSRIPLLGDLPYVGFMFKQKTKTESKSELIIMLTPKIVDDGLNVKM